MTLLEVREAARRYGEIEALTGVGFQLDRGEVVGLLGPNGAGKSTLMRSIVTLERLDSGSITVSGADVGTDPAAAREQIGYAGQDLAIDKVLTGREFLHFQGGLVHLPKAEIAPRAIEMLERLGLTDAADRRCEGYSGGMRRRLDLAASLMHQPALLVLDEPSSGLDYDARRRLWDFLLGMKAEGTALLVATHDFEEADALCDRVVLMSRGRVAAEGAPDALRTGLGSWIVTASLGEHAAAGDADRLAALFAGTPGQALPPDPRRAEFGWVLPAGNDEAGRQTVAAVEQRAIAAGTPLFSIALRRPTLQDVYRVEVGASFEAEEAHA